MPLNIAVVSRGPEGGQVRLEDEDLEHTLGTDESGDIPVRLDEMVRSITETIGASIQTKNNLKIEITGKITLSGKGSIKWLFST